MVKEKQGFRLRAVRAWFDLTVEERRLVLGILAIVLVGLCARYLRLQAERPVAYHPEGVQQLEQEGVQ